MKSKYLLLVGLFCCFAQLKAQETSSPCEGCIRYWPDDDNDGSGDHWAAWAYHLAGGWPGHAANDNDCDDGDPNIQMLYWYIDADGDGYGREIGPIASCGVPNGGSGNNWDCDDHNADLNPNTVWYTDNDHDGLGSSVVAGIQCAAPVNGVLNQDDCDDNNNGTLAAPTWYIDADGDGFGENDTIVNCTQPNGYVDNNWDQCPEMYGTIMGCVVPNDGAGNHGSFNDLNYIITSLPKIPVTDTQQITQPEDINTSIVYYDGLGRPVQNISSRQSLSGNDIAAHMKYDAQGRLTHEYLPLATSQNSLAYIQATSLESQTATYYSDTYNSAVAFSEKQYEESPLNRISKQASPGTEWAIGSGHEIKTAYTVNTSGDQVKWYVATSTWNPSEELYIPNLAQDAFYPLGQLYKTIIYDENNDSNPLDETQGSVIEFKNREGQVVLKRTYGEDLDNVGTEKHDTYYVYDQFGNLSYVIPPLADGYNPLLTTTQESLCYQYQYDAKNRLTAKRLPGKSWDYLIYDSLDRLVMTGPASSPFTDGGWGWLYNKYDDFNRICFTGWIKSRDTRHDYQLEYNSSHIYNAFSGQSTIGNVLIGYSSSHIPDDFHLLTVNYYDKYDFTVAPSTLPTSILSQDVLSNVKGLPTGKWVRILTTETEYKKEESYVLYDKKSRAIFNYVSNIDNGYTKTSNSYNFIGQILRTDTEHKKSNAAGPPLSIREDFEYNPQGKLMNHFHKINNRRTELLAHNDYDELGNPIIKNVGGQDVSSFVGIQKVDYQYNIRGWLTAINNVDDLSDNGNDSDLFAFKLNYAQPEGTFADPLYNGNISEILWISSSDNFKRKYSYLYDTMNRLKHGIYENTVTSALYNYDESMVYDKNGNITHLQRNGYGDDQGNVFNVDDLMYSYSSTNRNRIVKINDLTDDPKGFNDDSDNDPTDATNDYTYDSKGNMYTDDNKGITGIYYNHLDLPIKIEFGPAATILYSYNAEGRKILKSASDGTNPTVTTTYHQSGFQYKNGVLQFFPTAEGYVKFVSSPSIADNYGYVYNYLDHLGNIRLSYAIDPSNGELKILEENHYYPFGLKHMDYNTAKKEHNGEESILKIKPIPVGGLPTYDYKYNGKEWQDELGLEWYDYQARNYDPAIGRWMNIDPLAEVSRRWSPYSYCYNNPVFFVDPDGMWPYPIVFRSFHPSSAFGAGTIGMPPTIDGRPYSGDNRSFSLADGVSSRIHHRVVADPQAGTVSYAGRGLEGTYSNSSHHPTWGNKTDIPDGYIGNIKSGNNSVSFLTGYEGTNPLGVGPTPDIDVDAKFSLSQKGDILNISGKVNGDDFPNTEATITDPSGQKLFIGTDVRAAGQDNMPTILFGPATENIMNIDMNIKTDAKGNFMGVMQGDKMISRDDWNKSFLNQNPNPTN